MTTSGAVNKESDLFPLEPICLHRVPWLESLEALEPDSTLLAGGHLAHVLLEVLQRADPAFEHQLLAPHQLDPASTADLALHDPAASDHSQARDLDRGDDLNPTLPNLPIGWLAKALCRALHILRQLVDDVVVADLDFGPLGRRL